MGKRKFFYVAQLMFPSYATKPFRAHMTEGQAEQIGKMLEKHKKAGAVQDYHLGIPNEQEWTHALVLSADALKAELIDLIEVEKRLSSDR